MSGVGMWYRPRSRHKESVGRRDILPYLLRYEGHEQVQKDQYRAEQVAQRRGTRYFLELILAKQDGIRTLDNDVCELVPDVVIEALRRHVEAVLIKIDGDCAGE